jgi:hypothetical protein
MVRTLALAAVLVAALGGSAAAQTDTQTKPETAPKKLDLSGVYLCEGMNPDGHPYRGVVEIAAIESTYLVRWTLPDDIVVMGVGIVEKGMLSVAYFGGTPAVVVYEIDADRLVGEWTMGGTEGMTYAETLTKMDLVLPEHPSEQPKPRARPLPVKGVRAI